jgi:hypothetical protein
LSECPLPLTAISEWQLPAITVDRQIMAYSVEKLSIASAAISVGCKLDRKYH